MKLLESLRQLCDRELAMKPFVAGRRLFLAGLSAALLAGGIAIAPDALARDRSNLDWIGTWATSPQTQNATQVPVEFPAGTTLRQIVRISLGGGKIAVRFSNELGTTPLHIGAASIAVRSTEASIVPGTHRPLTFGGKTSIVVPPGAPALSDPVHLHARTLADLAISMYLPDGATSTTFHNIGLQTNYISPPGDYTGSPALPVLSTALNYFFLSGVNVKAPEKADVVVALGDSITDGTRSTPDTNSRWPNFFFQRLQQHRSLDHIAVLNEGISGNRILSAGSGPNTLSRLDRDVLAKPEVDWLVVLIGINDIGNSARGTGPVVTARDIIAGYRQIIARAHEHGIKVYGGTLTPIAGSGYDFPIAEATRQVVNKWIRTSREFDAVIDFDAVTRDPANPARFLPAYDSGDHLHPNDAGYEAMAKAIPLKLFGSGHPHK